MVLLAVALHITDWPTSAGDTMRSEARQHHADKIRSEVAGFWFGEGADREAPWRGCLMSNPAEPITAAGTVVGTV